jgi:pimeloyl-ACP methyl ester carboxylesterase
VSEQQALILLHGGQHGSWCWEPLVSTLRADGETRRIIALDMPGCGHKRAAEGHGNDRIDDIAAGLVAELRGAGVQGAVLLGHSIAGVLMPRMATLAPDLFAHLVFLATAVPEQGQSVMQMFGGGLQGEDPDHIGWPLDPATVDPLELSKAMFGADLGPEQLSWLLSEVAQDHIAESLQYEPVDRRGYRGLVESTYILTLRDAVLPVAWQRKFAERLGCAEVVPIDTPHEPFISHPRLLADAVRSVLAGSSRS